jgi:outer membrane receptor protein involved in Fe transport
MYENKRCSFSYQGGLRIEYTSIATQLKTDEEANERSYLDFFPSLALTYEITDLNSIQVSYSRRLDRPYFRELNPYNTFNNDRNYRTGNPQLDPEFTGAYDLGYVYNEKNTSFYVGSFYRKTVNEIENVDTLNNAGITISKPYNLASRDNFGIEARYSTELYDWWDINISSYFYRGSTSGFAYGEDLNNVSYTMDASASLDFDVMDWFELQINGDYRAPEKEGQDTEKAMYEVNMGLRKDLFDNKGHISLSIRDLFNTDRYRSRVDGSNFTAQQMFRWREGPVFSLTFSYELKDADAEREGSSIIGAEGERGGGF